jgi:hypothetical protein
MSMIEIRLSDRSKLFKINMPESTLGDDEGV